MSLHLGLLIIRIGIGIMFILHGYPKLLAGPEMWSQIGMAMGNFGIKAYPEIFGLMAALSEALGGLLLILGLFFRPACGFMLFTMIVAAMMHLSKGDGINVASHAIESGIVFLGLLFSGPGDYSLAKKLNIGK